MTASGAGRGCATCGRVRRALRWAAQGWHQHRRHAPGAASQVAARGGPAGLAIPVGMVGGVIVHQTTQNMRGARIGEFVVERGMVAVAEVRAHGRAPRNRSRNPGDCVGRKRALIQRKAPSGFSASAPTIY